MAPLRHLVKLLLSYQSWVQSLVRSDVKGRCNVRKSSWEEEKARSEYSELRYSEGMAYPGCMATQDVVLQAQRWVSGEGPALIWVGVWGGCCLAAFCSGQLQWHSPEEVRSSRDLGTLCVQWVSSSSFAGWPRGECHQALVAPGGQQSWPARSEWCQNGRCGEGTS